MEHTALVRDIVIFGVLISLLAVVIQDALSNFPFWSPHIGPVLDRSSSLPRHLGIFRKHISNINKGVYKQRVWFVDWFVDDSLHVR